MGPDVELRSTTYPAGSTAIKPEECKPPLIVREIIEPMDKNIATLESLAGRLDVVCKALAGDYLDEEKPQDGSVPTPRKVVGGKLGQVVFAVDVSRDATRQIEELVTRLERLIL